MEQLRVTSVHPDRAQGPAQGVPSSDKRLDLDSVSELLWEERMKADTDCHLQECNPENRRAVGVLQHHHVSRSGTRCSEKLDSSTLGACYTISTPSAQLFYVCLCVCHLSLFDFGCTELQNSLTA